MYLALSYESLRENQDPVQQLEDQEIERERDYSNRNVPEEANVPDQETKVSKNLRVRIWNSAAGGSPTLPQAEYSLFMVLDLTYRVRRLRLTRGGVYSPV